MSSYSDVLIGNKNIIFPLSSSRSPAHIFSASSLFFPDVKQPHLVWPRVQKFMAARLFLQALFRSCLTLPCSLAFSKGSRHECKWISSGVVLPKHFHLATFVRGSFTTHRDEEGGRERKSNR